MRSLVSLALRADHQRLHTIAAPARRQRGQTFIEVMVIVAVLSILAAVLIPKLIYARQQAQFAASQTTLREIASGLELYYNDQSQYPAGTGTDVTAALFTPTGGTDNYYNSSPLSPNGGAPYTYTLNTTGPAYDLKDPGTYSATLLANMQKGTAASDTLTGKCGTGCTHLNYNPDVGLYGD